MKTPKSKWLTCGIVHIRAGSGPPSQGCLVCSTLHSLQSLDYIAYNLCWYNRVPPQLLLYSCTTFPTGTALLSTFSMPPSPPGSLPERDLRFGEGRYYKTVQPFLSTLPYLCVHYLAWSVPARLVQSSSNPFNSLLGATLRHVSWLGTPCYLHLSHLPSASVPTMGLRGSFVSSSASSSSSKRISLHPVPASRVCESSMGRKLQDKYKYKSSVVLTLIATSRFRRERESWSRDSHVIVPPSCIPLPVTAAPPVPPAPHVPAPPPATTSRPC